MCMSMGLTGAAVPALSTLPFVVVTLVLHRLQYGLVENDDLRARQAARMTRMVAATSASVSRVSGVLRKMFVFAA